MGRLLWLTVIGFVAGCLAGALVKGGSFGILGDIVGGVLGGVSGGHAFGSLGISSGGRFGQVLMATAGATLAIYALRLAGKTARHNHGSSTDFVSVAATSPVPLIRRPSRGFGNAAVSSTDVTSHLG